MTSLPSISLQHGSEEGASGGCLSLSTAKIACEGKIQGPECPWLGALPSGLSCTIVGVKSCIRCSQIALAGFILVSLSKMAPTLECLFVFVSLSSVPGARTQTYDRGDSISRQTALRLFAQTSLDSLVFPLIDGPFIVTGFHLVSTTNLCATWI